MKPTLWPPAAILAVGALLATAGVKAQRSLPLRAPLAAAVPDTVAGYTGSDQTLTADEQKAAGVSSYLLRVYVPDDSAAAPARYVAVYVGYYENQTSGRTIHSPKNCLPGSGWEPLTSAVASVPTPAGGVSVNRYLIQKGRDQALVLYWYQGRGRVAASEYGVKWDLLRDAALRRRSDEALVRVVVPIRSTEAAAFALAARVAAHLVTGVSAALPAA